MKTRLILSALILCTVAFALSYSTSFPSTENPISEEGRWVNGLATGLVWANVRSSGGKAFGTQDGAGNFDDSIAYLTGSWGPDQTVQATVVTPSGFAGEVEVLVRWNITANSATGYEVNCSASYTEIVVWEGNFADFGLLSHVNTAACINGAVLKVTVVGNTITSFINGTQMAQVTDTTWGTGHPGIGFYNGGAGTNSNWALTNYSATDGISSVAGSFLGGKTKTTGPGVFK